MSSFLWQQALHHHQCGQYQEALRYYQRINRKAPNIDALFNMGIVHTRLEHLEEAEKCYQTILSLQPFHAKAKNNLALLCQKQGFLFRAEKLLRELLRDDPWNLDISNNLAGVLLGQGRPDEACSMLYPALKRDPLHAISWDTLGACLQDMGDIETALASFYRAHQQAPQNIETLFHLHGLLHDLNTPELALETLLRARSLAPHRWDLQFYEHCLISWYNLGSTDLTLLEASAQKHQPWLDSWKYIAEHRTANTQFFYSVAKTLHHAVSQASLTGLVLEFGVRFGTTAKLLQQYSGQEVHGFDSFQGLPTSWHEIPQGAYSTNGVIPDLGKNILLHAGWFSDSLPSFCQEHPQGVRLLHVDCDLYSSTKDILEMLHNQLIPDTIVVFDEYIMNPKWKEDEFKAWQEFCLHSSITYEYISFSPMSNQTALRILADIDATT